MWGMDRTALAEHEAPAVQALFERIVEAERGLLTTEQAADPRKYLLETWHTAAEAVMRPIQTRAAIEQELDKLRPKTDPFDFGAE